MPTLTQEQISDAHYDKLAALEAERGRIQADGFMAELEARGLVEKTADASKTIGRTVAAAVPGLGSRLRAGAARAGAAVASRAGAAVSYAGKNKALVGTAAAGLGLAGVGAAMAGKGNRSEGAALGPAGVAIKSRLTKESKSISNAAHDAATNLYGAKRAVVKNNPFARASAVVGMSAATLAGNVSNHVGANKKIYGGLGAITAAGTAAAIYDRHTGGSLRSGASAGVASAKSKLQQATGAVKMRLTKKAADGAWHSASGAFTPPTPSAAAKAGLGSRVRDAARRAGASAGAAGRKAVQHVGAHPKSYGAGALAAVGTGVGFAAYKHKKKSEKTAASLRLEDYLSTGA